MTTTTPAPSPPTMNTLSIAIDGEIGMLTLERPESLNAMSPEMIGELVLASGWLADRAALRALIDRPLPKAWERRFPAPEQSSVAASAG